MADIDTHNLFVEFGKHKGTRWTQLPVSYLKWLANQQGENAQIAQAELDRRGTQTPDLDVSGHAIDRASLSCRKRWHESAHDGEGIHAWLCRLAAEALAANERDAKGRYLYEGMKFCFQEGSQYPVLKTVMPINNT